MQIDSTPTLCANSENLNANATEGWSFCQLDELVDEIIDRRGVTPLKLGSEFKANGHRVISAKLIKDDRIDLDADEPRFVDEPTYKRWMSSPLEADDVILTSEAPLGETAYIREILDWCLGQRLFGIRTRKDRLIGRFLFYALKYAPVRGDLLSRATGTTAQGIRQSELRRVRIPTPPLPEQRAIAHILGTLDDKIELNRRMNQTLEELARALFHSWFVAFDPVRAKAAGRQPAGMDAATAALFPDAFEVTERGEIPAGWRFLPIGDAIRAVGGSTPRTSESAYWDGNIAFCTPKDLSALASPVLLETSRHITDAGAATISSGVLPVGTVLMSSRAPIGYLAIAALETTVNQGIIAMICDGILPNHYVYLWVRHNMATIKGRANGTTFLEISKRSFRPISALIPPEPVLGAFERIAASLFERIEENDRESRTITEMRDSMLPRLVSGDLLPGA